MCHHSSPGDVISSYFESDIAFDYVTLSWQCDLMTEKSIPGLHVLADLLYKSLDSPTKHFANHGGVYF